jgi:hypothetical protein
MAEHRAAKKLGRILGVQISCKESTDLGGGMVVCTRSYNHDNPKKDNPTDHYDFYNDMSWPSERRK